MLSLSTPEHIASGAGYCTNLSLSLYCRKVMQSTYLSLPELLERLYDGKGGRCSPYLLSLQMQVPPMKYATNPNQPTNIV
jgi:hypothetical protein